MRRQIIRQLVEIEYVDETDDDSEVIETQVCQSLDYIFRIHSNVIYIFRIFHVILRKPVFKFLESGNKKVASFKTCIFFTKLNYYYLLITLFDKQTMLSKFTTSGFQNYNFKL